MDTNFLACFPAGVQDELVEREEFGDIVLGEDFFEAFADHLVWGEWQERIVDPGNAREVVGGVDHEGGMLEGDAEAFFADAQGVDGLLLLGDVDEGDDATGDRVVVGEEEGLEGGNFAGGREVGEWKVDELVWGRVEEVGEVGIAGKDGSGFGEDGDWLLGVVQECAGGLIRRGVWSRGGRRCALLRERGADRRGLRDQFRFCLSFSCHVFPDQPRTRSQTHQPLQ